MTKEELTELWNTDEETRAMFERSKELNDKADVLTKKIRLIDNEVIAKLEDGYRGYRSAKFSKTLDEITDILVERKAINQERSKLIDEIREITDEMMSWL